MNTLIKIFAFVISIGSTYIQAQDKNKVDSILKIIDNSKIDTVKAENYLILSDLTMYNTPQEANNYIKKASGLYQKENHGKGIAKSYAQKATYYYTQGKHDSAKLYLEKSVETSLKFNDELRAAVVRHNIGILDQYTGNWKNTLKIMDTNIPIFIKYNDSLHLGNAYLMKGKVALLNGHFNIALDETLHALKIHEIIKDDFRTAEDMFQIGIIYQELDDHEKAIEIFTNCIQLYEKIDNLQTLAQVQNYLGLSYLNQTNFDLAKDNFEKALNISNQINYKTNIARSLANLGRIDLEYNKYDDAITKFNKALDLQKGITPGGYNVAMIIGFIGQSYMKKSENKTALKYFDEAIALGDSIEDPKTLVDLYFLKSLTLENLNDFQNALITHKKAKELHDDIFSKERIRHIEELQAIYETGRKEKEIAFQKAEIELLNQEAKINSLQRILLATGLGLSLLIFGIGFYALKQKVKRNKLEKEKVDAELDHKKKELTTHALHLAKKNELLDSLKQKAEELKEEDGDKKGYQQLIRTINFDLQDDNNWENFRKYFEEVHKNFNTEIKQKFPEITSNELRLLALLKMNLSSKEIANILNVSQEGIKKARYRLRKKLNITSDESLEDLVINL